MQVEIKAKEMRLKQHSKQQEFKVNSKIIMYFVFVSKGCKTTSVFQAVLASNVKLNKLNLFLFQLTHVMLCFVFAFSVSGCVVSHFHHIVLKSGHMCELITAGCEQEPAVVATTQNTHSLLSVFFHIPTSYEENN